MPWGRCQVDVRPSERWRNLFEVHLGSWGVSLGVEGRHSRLERVKVRLLFLCLSSSALDTVWHLLALTRCRSGRGLLCGGC